MILLALVFQYVGWGGEHSNIQNERKKFIKRSREYDVYAGECFDANG